eukprot:gene7291-6866_t
MGGAMRTGAPPQGFNPLSDQRVGCPGLPVQPPSPYPPSFESYRIEDVSEHPPAAGPVLLPWASGAGASWGGTLSGLPDLLSKETWHNPRLSQMLVDHGEAELRGSHKCYRDLVPGHPQP